MWARLARKYFRPVAEKSASVSGWRTSRARGPHRPMQQVPGVMSRTWTVPSAGRWRVNQSRSRLPLAPTWKRSGASRATVTSLRMPPSWSRSSVYVTEPTDLATLPVHSRSRNSPAPRPLTSSRLRAVMSYIATVSRVVWASAATMGDQYRAAQSLGVTMERPSTRPALASYHWGRSQPFASRKKAPSSCWRVWNGLVRIGRGSPDGWRGCRMS